MPSIGQAGLHTQLSAWAAQNKGQTDVGALSVKDLQAASKALEVPLTDVIASVEAQVSAAAAQAAEAGASFSAFTGKGKGAGVGHGGSRMDASAAMARFHTCEDGADLNTKGAYAGKYDAGQYDAGKYDAGKGGKTAGGADSDVAMGAFDISFGSKADAKWADVHVGKGFDGYYGGSDDIDLFFAKGFSIEDAAHAKAFFGLNDLGDAKAFIGNKVAIGAQETLEKAGISPSPYDAHEMKAAFENSAYNDSHARQALVRLPFLDSLDEARAYIGLKVVNDRTDVLKDAGIDVGGMSTFWNSGYSFADAEAVLDAFPSLGTLAEAKAYIGDKIANDAEFVLKELGITQMPWDGHEQLEAFHSANYTIDDAAAALAAFDFLHTMDDAKGYIGLKVINDTESILKNEGITRDRFDSHDEHGAFWRSSYTMSDAERAADAFDFLTDTYDAKGYIGLKVLNGSEGILADVGIMPGHHDDMMDDMHAFAASPYTEADARKAVMAFTFLDSVQDAKAYIGLKINNGYEAMLEGAGITKSPTDAHECLAAYRAAEYTRDDVQTLMKQPFIHTPAQAREYLGLKVLQGTEHVLRDFGVTPAAARYGKYGFAK